MYGEFFDIPAPDELVFLSTFSGGEVFRSGCTFRRGHGKVFYFRPGDQEYPTYHHPDVRRVIANARRVGRHRPSGARASRRCGATRPASCSRTSRGPQDEPGVPDGRRRTGRCASS